MLRVETVWAEAREAFKEWNNAYSVARQCRREIEKSRWTTRRVTRLSNTEGKKLVAASITRKLKLNHIPLCILHFDMRLEQFSPLNSDLRSLVISYIELHVAASYQSGPRSVVRAGGPPLRIHVPCWCTWTLPGRLSTGDVVVKCFSRGQYVIATQEDLVRPILVKPEARLFYDKEWADFYTRIGCIMYYLCDWTKETEPTKAALSLLGECVEYPLAFDEFQPLLDRLAKDTQTMRVTR